MKFSKAFGLNQGQPGLDFVDVDPSEDLPLFFDPYVFANEDDAFCMACDQSIKSFFQRVLDAVIHSKTTEGHQLLSYLSEPNEICFGWSRDEPAGRGIGDKQAKQIYHQLKSSAAGKSGLLTDLSECELFVQGIGPDKISDITANIIRNHLIKYTQEQCELHGIQDLTSHPTSATWNIQKSRWEMGYADLPVVAGTPVILVPKRTVRWIGDLSHQHQKYYRHFVLNFLKDSHLRAGDRFVHILSDGSRRVYKTELEEEYPLSKDFLFRFSRDNPAVFESYRDAYKKTHKITISELDQDFSDEIFVASIKKQLASTPSGPKHASAFHRLMVGILEYLFYPNLTYPKIEHPIHDNRKRIDIVYANAATGGFFNRISAHHKLTSVYIMVECKNYSSDPANPELDQIVGRFGPNRGYVGLLVARRFENRDLFFERCRDAAKDLKGYVIPLVDEDVEKLLNFAAAQRRSQIDEYLESILLKLMS